MGLSYPSFDEGSVIKAAQQETGLEDFGSDDFREPLRILLSDLEHESRLTFVGRVAARSQAITLLANRLQMQDWWTRHPEMLSAPVAAPWFVVGLPRSGTTLLQQLLACDPENRSLLFWEARCPAPPPERATYDVDPRIPSAERAQRLLDYLAPDANRIHPVGAQLPTECVSLLAHSFASLEFGAINHVPNHLEWCRETDLTSHYEYFRSQLQLLQWRCAGARWTLKSPAHLLALAPLLEVFPDARVIWLHRDPALSVTSHCSLVSVLHAIGSNDVDRLAVGREWPRIWEEAVARALQSRASQPDAFHDVAYDDLVRDPIGMVRRIYAWSGAVLEESAEESMRRFLDAHHQHARGVHQYDARDFGLGNAELRTHRFAAYEALFPN